MFSEESIKKFFHICGCHIQCHTTKKSYVVKITIVNNMLERMGQIINKENRFLIPLEIGEKYGSEYVWNVILFKFCEYLDVQMIKYVAALKLSDNINLATFLKNMGVKYLSTLFVLYQINVKGYRYLEDFLSAETGIPPVMFNKNYLRNYYIN